MEFSLPILYQDPHLVVVNKPCDMLVHRNQFRSDKPLALQTLRRQLDQYVYPVHRLDSRTSGVLVFGLSPEVTRVLNQQFTDSQVHKLYLAIVRGWTEGSGTIDSPLKRDGNGPLQEAITHYLRLQTTEVPIPVDRYPTARYSLVRCHPKTGRMHQIRRHFAHLRHPIIGDKKHGDRHHNRMFVERLGIDTMMLHAWKMTLAHPVSGEQMDFEAEIPEGFGKAMDKLGFLWNF